MLVVRRLVVAEPILERRDLRLHVEQRLESQARFFVQRPPAVRETVLRQVSDRQAGGFDDRARVGLVDAREHLQKGRLAGAVRAAQPNPLAVVDLPRHRIEQDAVAEGFGECGKLNHE